MSPASSLTAKDVDIYDTTADVHHDLYDESCTLLSHQQSSVENQISKLKPTPIPKLQLATLCLVRLLEPIGFTQIFPWINEALVRFDMVSDPSKVGFVSGMVESTFAIFQMLSVYHWAKLSDIIGRRPVVLGGALGMGVMTFLFGLSQSLPHILITRAINGAFAGNIAVVQSVVGEISDSSNQAFTYPLYAMCWPLGAILGPLLGGTFSDPAAKYPKLFDFPFLRKYPYFFPCFVASMISCIGATVGYFFLQETLPSKCRHAGKSAVKSYGTAELPDSPTPVSAKALLSTPIIRALSTSGFALAFIACAFDTVFVLFCFSPVEIGGLSFTTSEIGLALAGSGILSVLLQMFLMPILLSRDNLAEMYHTCMLFWFTPFVLLPFLNIIAKNGLDEFGQIQPNAKALVWTGVGCVILISRLCCLAFSFSMILIKDNVPNPSSLGATNGLINVAMCSARIFSPAFANSAFALSVQLEILGGSLWVVVLSVIALLGSFCSTRVVYECKKVSR